MIRAHLDVSPSVAAQQTVTNLLRTTQRTGSVPIGFLQEDLVAKDDRKGVHV